MIYLPVLPGSSRRLFRPEGSGRAQHLQDLQNRRALAARKMYERPERISPNPTRNPIAVAADDGSRFQISNPITSEVIPLAISHTQPSLGRKRRLVMTLKMPSNINVRAIRTVIPTRPLNGSASRSVPQSKNAADISNSHKKPSHRGVRKH